jgi:hypothetical protein
MKIQDIHRRICKGQERFNEPFLSSSFTGSGNFQFELKGRESNGNRQASEKCPAPRKSLLWTNFPQNCNDSAQSTIGEGSVLPARAVPAMIIRKMTFARN